MEEQTTCKHNFVVRRWKGMPPDAPRKCIHCGLQEVLTGRTAIVEVARKQMDEAGRLGPHMKVLTAMQQRFVLLFLEMGTGNATEAAEAAGYGAYNDDPKQARQRVRERANALLHDPKVQMALQEEGRGRINGMAAKAMKRLDEILDKPEVEVDENGKTTMRGTAPKDMLKAIEMVLNRAGIHGTSEQIVRVEQVTDAEKIARIKLLASGLGLDATKLLGSAGKTIDAEYVEVKP